LPDALRAPENIFSGSPKVFTAIADIFIAVRKSAAVFSGKELSGQSKP